MTDDFSNFPPSITELRSDRTQRAADWTPRDALIKVLRDIDNGEIELNTIFIAYRGNDKGNPVEMVGYQAAGITVFEILGTLEYAKHNYLRK